MVPSSESVISKNLFTFILLMLEMYHHTSRTEFLSILKPKMRFAFTSFSSIQFQTHVFWRFPFRCDRQFFKWKPQFNTTGWFLHWIGVNQLEWQGRKPICSTRVTYIIVIVFRNKEALLRWCNLNFTAEEGSNQTHPQPASPSLHLPYNVHQINAGAQ